MEKGRWMDNKRIIQNTLYKDTENASSLNDGFDKQAERKNILGNERKNFHCVAQFFGWSRIIIYSVRYGYFHNYSESWLILHHSSQHFFCKGIKCNDHKSMCSVKLLKIIQRSRSHWLFPLKNIFLFSFTALCLYHSQTFTDWLVTEKNTKNPGKAILSPISRRCKLILWFYSKAEQHAARKRIMAQYGPWG